MADDFLGTYAPLANDIAGRTGVDPAVVLGIIDTETGGGKHVLGNNIFGITPPGGVARYPDVQSAANAFVTLMQTPRYRGVAAATDPASQAVALVKGGYNTVNPQYASIVANKALSIGKQLGYQDKSGGDTEEGPAVYSTSSQPAATADQPPAPSDSDTFFPAGSTQPAQPPATSGSAKDRVLADPALGGTSAAPAAGSTAKDRVLADPALAAPATTTTTQETVPAQDPYSGAPTSDNLPSWMMQEAPSSLEDLRARMQRGETGVLNALRPGADASVPEQVLRTVGAVGVHALSSLAQLPVNALIGLREGPSGGVTWNPETGTYGLTQEAAAVPQLLAGAGPRDIRFVPRGGNPLEFVPPARSGGPLPPDIAGNLLSPDARARIAEGSAPVTVQSSPTGIKPPDDIPTVVVRPGAAGETTENQAWVGNTRDEIQRVVQENAATGGPSALGAQATPQQLAAMSPQMAKAYRRMAELNRVVSPIEGEDWSIKVPGSIPTEAEGMGNPVTSQKEVMTRTYAPDSFEGPQGRLTQNNAARLQAYDGETLSDPQIQTLREQQIKQAQIDEANVLKNAGPVNGTPVATQLDSLLNSPRIMEQPDVVKVLQPIRDALYDSDGKLKTDIQSYWGMHDNLMQKLAKAKDPLQSTSAEKFAFSQLNGVKQTLDQAMTDASGGAFRTFLDNQADFIKQQNAAKILNDFRAKMTDPKTGNIYPNQFHRFVTDLAVRRGRPGVDPAMDIPDNTMSTLMDVDDDLKRAGRIDLGKPRGSPTNLYFELARGLGIAGAHAITAASGVGPVGNIFLQGAIGGVERRLGAMRRNRLVRQALEPQQFNPLQQQPPP